MRHRNQLGPGRASFIGARRVVRHRGRRRSADDVGDHGGANRAEFRLCTHADLRVAGAHLSALRVLLFAKELALLSVVRGELRRLLVEQGVERAILGASLLDARHANANGFALGRLRGDGVYDAIPGAQREELGVFEDVFDHDFWLSLCCFGFTF